MTKNTNKQSTEIRKGDVVMFLGTPHLIDHIQPYEGVFDGTNDMPKCIGIAKASDGWGISLFEGTDVEVAS